MALFNRHYHERKTAVVMETIDHLSTYIYVYLDNYQNDIDVKEIMILFSLQIVYCQFTARIQFAVSEYIRHYSVILTRSRSGAETKRNTCNNFTK